MNWTLKRTDTFQISFSNFRNNPVILKELEKKLKRLKEDPFHVGGVAPWTTPWEASNQNCSKISPDFLN
ncbi:MAG: hypothetical protein A4E37_01281 [Methanoregulaceae archaeon PtaB.Bin056]|jgi:hypothetical protein|nr:MAG: hypothetical protein A4E37_01281 [Methanoregulaceae archaeon PtaB.Bin056]